MLYGRRTRSGGAVRSRVTREGGLVQLLGREVTASVGGATDNPILIVLSGWRERNVVDELTPEANFRWDAMNGRWDLVSLQEPPMD